MEPEVFFSMRSNGLLQQVERRVKRFPRTLFTLLLVLLTLTAVFTYAAVRAEEVSVNRTKAQMQDSAGILADLTNLYIEDRMQACVQSAELLALRADACGAAESAALDKLSLNADLAGLAVYLPDSDRITQRGSGTLSAAQRAALQADASGGPLVLPLGEEGGGFAVAARVPDEGPRAYLVCFHASDALRELLTSAAFQGAGMTFVVAGDGRYVLRTSESALATSPNFLQAETIRLLDGVTIEDVRADFAAGRSRLTRYATSGSVLMYGYYTPLHALDWYLFTAVRDEIAGEAARRNQQLLRLACIVSFVGLAALVTVISYENMRQKKALRAVNREALTARKMIARLLSEADCLAFFYTPGDQTAQLLNDVDAPDQERLERELFRPQKDDDLVLPDDAPRHQQMLAQLNRLEPPDPLVLRLRLFPAATEYRFCKLTFTLAESQHGKPMFLCAVKDEDSARREAITLRELSRRDGLTKLYNRRACVELVNEQLARRGQGTFIYLDLDHFKHINDSHGHKAGDEALLVFAECLRSAFFLSDILARLGGDEFVVYSPYFISQENATKHLVRLQQELDAKSCGYTFSAGIAFAREGDGFDSLYVAADKALYQAKGAGRKQFVFYGDGASDETGVK